MSTEFSVFSSRPDLVDFGRMRKLPARENLRLAFDIADRVFGVTPLLDPEGTRSLQAACQISYDSSLVNMLQ